MLNTSQKYSGIIILIVFSILSAQPAYKLETQEGKVPGKIATGFELLPTEKEYNFNFQTINDEIVETGYEKHYNYNHNGVGRDTPDTLAYDYAWGAYFYGTPGDVFMTTFQAPADLTIKAVSVPVYRWGTGEQLTVSIHKVSYPYGSDGAMYDQGLVNGSGWLAGYDDGAGNIRLEGTTWNSAAGVCGGGAMIGNATDPLGTVAAAAGPPGTMTMGLAWPDGSTAATLDPTNNPGIENGGGDNWMNLADLGSEVAIFSGEYIGVAVRYTGTGGDGSDPGIGFMYAAHTGSPWASMKFYAGAADGGTDCMGIGGETGWYIRGWCFNFQLAVDLWDNADAGPDQDVEFDSLVTLDGSASSADEYLWTQLSGDTVSLSSPTESITTFIAPSTVGVLSFQLTTTDSTSGSYDTDIVNINVTAPYQLLVINEIMNNPSAASDEEGEWFELYNGNSFTVDLNNWVISDNDNDSFSILPADNPVIQPYGYFVLGVNDDTTANGGIVVDLVYNRNDFNLGNSNDEIILYNPNGTEIDRVEYDNGQTFPDPNGKSMELVYYEYDNNDGGNWSESTHLLPSGDYATPGVSNSMLYPELYIDLIEGIFLGTYPETATVYSYQLEIQNNGTDVLLLSSIVTQLTGQDNPDSYIYTEYDQDSIIVIPPFEEGNIEIYFNPLFASIFHDTLMFTTNDSNYSYVEIPLEAWVTAEEHEIHIEPSLNELIFDTLEVGQSQEKVLQIYNLGYTTLEIDEISTTPSFSVDPEDGSIDALDFMDIVVSFSPDSVGNYVGALVIESNDSDEGTLVLSLIGYSYVLGVDDESNQLPFSYALHQNYPNPFNPVTTLRYDLPEQGLVNIIIYDIMGREIRTLVNTTQNAGYRSVIWDATNDYGKPVSAGVYLYQIQAGEFVQTKKMVLLK